MGVMIECDYWSLVKIEMFLCGCGGERGRRGGRVGLCKEGSRGISYGVV